MILISPEEPLSLQNATMGELLSDLSLLMSKVVSISCTTISGYSVSAASGSSSYLVWTRLLHLVKYIVFLLVPLQEPCTV